MGYGFKLYSIYIERCNSQRDLDIAAGKGCVPQVINHYPFGLTNACYKRFPKSNVDSLGVSHQTPLESSREEWATSKNIGRHYEIIKNVLLEKGFCRKNRVLAQLPLMKPLIL